MGAALIIASIGMSGMVVARLELRAALDRRDQNEAAQLADAAIEAAAASIYRNSAWRTTYLHGSVYPADGPLLLGRGEATWILYDNDGDLADNPNDSATLLGIGKVGDLEYRRSVVLDPDDSALDSLESSLHVAGQLSVDGGANISTNQQVSTNLSITAAGGGQIDGDAEASGTIQSGVVTGDAREGVAARTMPSVATVFSYYLNHGTTINYSDLPGGKIEHVVLSSESNPYGSGAANPRGIYVVDCLFNRLEIKAARIEATLVVLNPSSDSRLDGEVHWKPAVPNLPALLVAGDMEFDYEGGTPLSEDDESVNYNPPGTPYQGVADADELDVYPGTLTGLFYVSGTLEVKKPAIIDGVIVANALDLSDDLTLTYDPIYTTSPPPGFRSNGGIRLRPGAWRHEPND